MDDRLYHFVFCLTINKPSNFALNTVILSFIYLLIEYDTKIFFKPENNSAKLDLMKSKMIKMKSLSSYTKLLQKLYKILKTSVS